MCSGKAKAFERLCKSTQYLSTFLNVKATVAEELKLCVFVWYGWSVDDKTMLLVTACQWNLFYILLIVNKHTFLLQLKREGGRCLVIACNNEATIDEVTCYGTHSNATCTNEIYCFNILHRNMASPPALPRREGAGAR